MTQAPGGGAGARTRGLRAGFGRGKVLLRESPATRSGPVSATANARGTDKAQLTEDTGRMEAPWIRVKRDVFTSTWRVTCDLHGAVSRPGNFWTASRDKRDHAQVCELIVDKEETDPSA